MWFKLKQTVLMLTLLLIGCFPHTNHSRIVSSLEQPRIATIYLSPEFTQQEKQQFLIALRETWRVGWTFVPVTNPPYNVTVKPWRNLDLTNRWIGIQHPGTNIVFIATHRIEPNLLKLRAVLLHELGHWMGMQHVCKRPGERQVCSSVGYGVAIMNPELGETGFAETYSELDIAELRRH